MNKLAKLKYLPNNFDIIEEVIMSFVQFLKENSITKFELLNVDEQEAYFSYVEASIKKEKT